MTQYEWKVEKCLGPELEQMLNDLQTGGWEIFQIILSSSSPTSSSFRVIARRPHSRLVMD